MGEGGAARETKYGVRKNISIYNEANPKKNKSNNKSENPTSPKGVKVFPPIAYLKILNPNSEKVDET